MKRGAQGLSICVLVLASTYVQPARAQRIRVPQSENDDFQGGQGEAGSDGSLAPSLSVQLDIVDNERLQWWPWVASAAFLSLAIVGDRAIRAAEPRWRIAGPIDRFVDANLPSDSATTRRRMGLASDALVTALIASTYLDAALWQPRHRSWSRTSYRLMMMDTLAFSLELSLVSLVKATVQRQRPHGRRCEENPSYGDCDSQRLNRSFFSGHAATAFTAASLMCAHQTLRGQTPLGRIQCLGSLAMATSVATLRVAAGHHYVSDVAVGALVGFLVGYVLPVWLFPRRIGPEPEIPETPTYW